MTRRVTSPTTGEQIWEVTGGHSITGAVLQNRQKQSFRHVTSLTGPTRDRFQGHGPPTQAQLGRSLLEAVSGAADGDDG